MAIDLTDLGLRYICETGDEVRIGAYITLRDMELSPAIPAAFGAAFHEVFRHLIGVQLRTHITLGAHVYARFGFSDLIPVLLSLNTQVRPYRGGEMPLNAFLLVGAKDVKRNILLALIVPKEGRAAKVQMMRSPYNDYSILCLAVSRVGDDRIIASGARLGRAQAYPLDIKVKVNGKPGGVSGPTSFWCTRCGGKATPR